MYIREERENSRRIIYSITVFVLVFRYDLYACTAIISCEYRVQEIVSKIFKGLVSRDMKRVLKGPAFKSTCIINFFLKHEKREIIYIEI